MTKYLILIALFAAIALFAYWRLRPYLKMAGKVLGVLRDVRRMSEGGRAEQSPQQQRQQGGGAAQKLVRCSSCGTWLPSTRALALRGSNATYCSQDCVERSIASEAKPKAVRR
ncbi:MAG TPA: hypothetical protein VE360_04090 [Pyrinomonadaceae bacterium]|nr:hypothetical protein [Pyrinomonadaceae bacterium]